MVPVLNVGARIDFVGPIIEAVEAAIAINAVSGMVSISFSSSLM